MTEQSKSIKKLEYKTLAKPILQQFINLPQIEALKESNPDVYALYQVDKHGRRDTEDSTLANDVPQSLQEVLSSEAILPVYSLLNEDNKDIFQHLVRTNQITPITSCGNTRGIRSKSYTKNIDYYLSTILDDIYVLQELNLDYIAYLTESPIVYQGEEILVTQGYHTIFNQDHVSAILSSKAGDEVYSYIKKMIYDNENLVNLDTRIIHALIACTREGSNEIVMDLLKAAKLSEGLRSAIAERIDMGSLDTFKYFLKYIEEENLVRFASIKRAFMCYTGFEYESGMTDSMDKVVAYSLDCLLHDKVEEYLKADNPLQNYVGLYAMACNEYLDSVEYVKKNLQSSAFHQQIAMLMFLGRMRKALPLDVINELMETGGNLQLFMRLADVNIDRNLDITKEQKIRFIKNVHSYMKGLKMKDMRVISLDMEKSSPIHRHEYYEQAFLFAHDIDDLYEEVYSLFDKFYYDYFHVWNEKSKKYEYGRHGSTLVKQKIGNPIVKQYIIASLSKTQSSFSFKILKESVPSLNKEDFLLIADHFKSKKSETRKNVNTLLSLADHDSLLGCIHKLIKEKQVEKRSGAISLLKENFDKIRENQLFIDMKVDLENAKLPDEVTAVRDQLLCAESQQSAANTAQYTWDTEYLLPLEHFTQDGAREERLRTTLLSALNKVTGLKSKVINDVLLEAAVEKFVAIFNSHLGEEVEYYRYQHEGKLQGKVGYEFSLRSSFYKNAYGSFENIPFFEEYDALTKDLSDAEMLVLRRTCYLMDEICDSFESTTYMREYLTLGKVFKNLFGYDLIEIRQKAKASNWAEYRSKLEHANAYCEALLDVRIDRAKTKSLQDQGVETSTKNADCYFYAEKQVADFCCDFFKQYAYFMQRIYTEQEEALVKEILEKAKETPARSSYYNDPSEGDPDHFAILRASQKYQYMGYTFFAPEIEIDAYSQEEKEQYDKIFFALSWIYLMPNNTLIEWQVTRIIKYINEQLCKADFFYNVVLIKRHVGIFRVLDNYLNNHYNRTSLPTEIKEKMKEIYTFIATYMIDVEHERSESETPYSAAVAQHCKMESAEVFIKTIYKMGKTSLLRGYSWSSGYPLKEVFSKLIMNTKPEKDLSQEVYNQLVKKYNISDQKLLEASMYNLKFMPYTEQYLKIDGMTKCSYYFRAHMNEGIRDEEKQIINRYSDIDTNEFRDGQMDLDWFKQSYRELGAEKFAMLYSAAKYITDGGKHKRAQYFADAVLGKLKLKDVESRINDKRNQEMILAYGLIPFDKKNKKKDALARYKRLQAFLKESKQFGAQRRASEALKVSIAMNNLARNYGYKDVQRFTWGMETELFEALATYFSEHQLENIPDQISVSISLADIEKPRLVVVKNGKVLKSLPSKYNKHQYIISIKEAQKELKEQFKRARISLENAMVYEDLFEFEELENLQNHAVISALLSKLLFVHDGKIGFLRENKLIDHQGNQSLLPSKASLRIAHAIDLLESDTWSCWQDYIISHEILQPFKQVFREVYVPTEDELKETGKSYRFAGYQIEKGRAMGILKTRSWLINDSQGFEKINHKSNLRIELYSYADWFMPSEVESPSIEKIEFVDNKTHKLLNIADLSKVFYSEIMRDMDLVVSVAYVGGVDPMLNQSTIEMRRRILVHNLQLFKIYNYSIENNHIMIKGKLNDYSLHLGSGVIHTKNKGMLPIFPVHSQQRGHIFLPFIDSDPKTSEIISKVLMLAQDDKIKDPSVLHHLK